MQDISFIALVYKIPNISSFKFVNAIKAALNKRGILVRKIGFLGTLDYFARGQLIIAINNATKLLPHIERDRKTYKATLFLGMHSLSLDSENVIGIESIKAFTHADIIESLPKGEIIYNAPAYSAKHINGQRAYKLARKHINADMPLVRTTIYSLDLLSYNHPFITFQTETTKGAYIRSIGEIICNNLSVIGALSYLERIKERDICYADSIKKAISIDIKNLTSILKEDSVDYPLCLTLDMIFSDVTWDIRLVILDFCKIINYDTIMLHFHSKEAYNGATINLDLTLCYEILTKDLDSNDYKHKQIDTDNSFLRANISYFNKGTNSGDMRYVALPRVFLADFGSHFAVINIHRNGRIEYILNRIGKC